MKLLLSFCIAIFCFPVHAAKAPPAYEKVTLQWARPSTRANNDRLLKRELKGYTVYGLSADSIAPNSSFVKTYSRNATKAVIKQPICSTWFYAISATDIDERQSALSEMISHTTSCPEPSL